MSKPKEKLKVLVVEDEPITRKMMIDYVTGDAHLELVDCAIDGKTATNLLCVKTYDLVFLDINLPVMSGFDVLAHLTYTPYVVFTTVYSHYAVQAYEIGALDYIVKPVSQERFALAVQRAVSYIRRIKPENKTEPEEAKSSKIPLFNILVNDYRLTYQEATITCLLYENNNRLQIAKLLSIKQTTLKNHLKTIYGKTIDNTLDEPSRSRDKQARLMIFLSNQGGKNSFT